MNFLAHPSPEGRQMLVQSVTRSLLRPDGMQSVVHDGPPSTTCTWWGAAMEVKAGDRIHYFQSPVGICVEWVEPPSGPNREA